MSSESAPIVIVGGGIAGLSAALRLVQAGHRVQVLEARERVGGVLGTRRERGAILETAANGFLGNAEEGALALAQELGVPLREAASAAKNRWIYLDGHLCPLPTSPGAFVRSRLLSGRAKLRLLGEPLHGPAGEDETIYEFARRRLGDEVARNIVAPFVTGIFAGDAKKLSLRAAFPRLAQLDDAGGLVRGLLKRAIGGGGDRPKRMRLSSPELGVQQLLDAISERLGDSVECGVEISELRPQQDGLDVVVKGGATRRASSVVLAVGSYQAADLVAGIDSEAASLLRRIPYVSMVVAHLLYRREQIEHDLDGFGFLVRDGEALGILGAVFESTLWPNRTSDDQVLIRCMLGGPRHPQVIDESDEEAFERAQSALAVTLGVRGQPVRRELVRWRNAIPQYMVGHRERVERVERALEKDRIVLAGSAYHGVSVNDCVAGGHRIVRRIAALAAATLMVASLACSSSAHRPAHPDDGGMEAAAGRPGADAPSAKKAGEQGEVVLDVVWKSPPAKLLSSPGANACRRDRRPLLSVHAAGGVRNAVVILDDKAGAPLAAKVEIRHCQVEPILAVVSTEQAVEFVNRDERAHHLVITPTARTPVRMAMRVIGQRHRVDKFPEGLTRIDLGRDRAVGHVFAGTGSRLATTDQRGQAHFKDVSPGRHRLVIVHPPVDARGKSLKAEVTVAVEAGQVARATVSLAP